MSQEVLPLVQHLHVQTANEILYCGMITFISRIFSLTNKEGGQLQHQVQTACRYILCRLDIHVFNSHRHTKPRPQWLYALHLTHLQQPFTINNPIALLTHP